MRQVEFPVSNSNWKENLFGIEWGLLIDLVKERWVEKFQTFSC
jgi:hypothetical protein